MFNKDPYGNEKIMDQLEFPVDIWSIGDPVDKKKIEIKSQKKKAGTFIFEVQAFPYTIPREIHKFLLIGDFDVGKTQLLNRLTNNEYVEDHLPQIGTDFKVYDHIIDGKKFSIQIWDAPGSHRSANINSPFFKRSDGFLLVFNITKRKFFESIVTFWYDFIKYELIKKVYFVLVGNMTYKLSERTVTFEEAESFAKNNGMKYF